MKTSGSNMNYVGCPSGSALRTSFGDNNPAIVFYIGSLYSDKHCDRINTFLWCYWKWKGSNIITVGACSSAPEEVFFCLQKLKKMLHFHTRRIS